MTADVRPLGEDSETARVVLEPGVDAHLVLLNTDQYHAMLRRELIEECAPIELIDGLMVRKDRRDGAGSLADFVPRIAFAIRVLTQRLMDLIERRIEGAVVHAQAPITIPPFNEPEPEISIVTGDLDSYDEAHPGPDDVLLVIEIGNNCYPLDSGPKKRIYASAGIPEYWIVNLVQNIVEVYTQPQPDRRTYAVRTDYRIGEVIPFRILGTELSLAVSEFLKLPKA